MLRIGNVKLDNPLVLAPMAGVTDHAFRLLCREHGAGLVCTEMISAPAVVRAFDTIDAFEMPLSLKDYFEQMKIDGERPVSMQLFGSTADELTRAAHVIEKSADIIDINLGCPSPKLTGAEMGSKLLMYPEKIFSIVSSVVSTGKKPVPVKMRLGYSSNNSLDIAGKCERAGVAAIAVHGRTTIQGYAGEANWNAIEKIKKAAGVPIIGNGDITTPEIAKKRLETVDAVMIGRAARGDPYIFSDTLEYLRTGKLNDAPTKEMRIRAFERYVELATLHEVKGSSNKEMRNLGDFKMQANYFMMGFENSAKTRMLIQNAKTMAEILKIVSST
jgi:nifR3 family TIM-barrel protein